MYVREYQLKDATYLFNINRSCFSSPEPNLSLLENIHKGQTWVCCTKKDDKPVGFLVSTYQNGAHVYNVAVDPDFRHKGIATSLFKEFHYFYREQHYAWLYVDTSNPAQKLYFDLGYRIKEIKYDYYGPGKDAYLMVKEF